MPYHHDFKARQERMVKAKKKVTELVDAGTPFNPETVSDFTADRARENYNRNAPGGLTGFGNALILSRVSRNRSAIQHGLLRPGNDLSLSAPRNKKPTLRVLSKKNKKKK